MQNSVVEIQALRLKRLGNLMAAIVLLSIAYNEISPYLGKPDGTNWWFWIGNAFLAIALSVGVLLSFWWGMEHKEKRKWYFFSLCVFFVFFVANCTKGLVVIASASVFSTEFQLIRGSCKAEVAICQNFVGSTKTEERNQWAATFFGTSGVNLLGTKADGTASKAPTQAAQNAWDARQSNDTYLRETIQLLGQASNAAIHVFTLNVIVALLVLALGGWRLSHRST